MRAPRETAEPYCCTAFFGERKQTILLEVAATLLNWALSPKPASAISVLWSDRSKDPQNMKGPLTPSGTILRAHSQGPNQKRKPPTKTKYTRFDTLVGRYYPAVYSFASRLTDDPREAVSLTHGAFNAIRKRRWRLRDEVMLATILLNAVIVAGLRAA
jgi:hypothetical protein